jgi:hypothetical protein
MTIKAQYNPSTSKVSYNPVTGKVQVFDPFSPGPVCSVCDNPSDTMTLTVANAVSCLCTQINATDSVATVGGDIASEINGTFELDSFGSCKWKKTVTLTGYDYDAHDGSIDCSGTPDRTAEIVSLTFLYSAKDDISSDFGLVAAPCLILDVTFIDGGIELPTTAQYWTFTGLVGDACEPNSTVTEGVPCSGQQVTMVAVTDADITLEV